MGINDKVKFEINQPRERIIEIFSQAKAAIHTMEFEHFGIAIVELMTSGIITIAHNSAGPKLDIIGPAKEPVGYLALSVEHYAQFAAQAIMEYSSDHFSEMRRNARQRSEIFSVEAFEEQFIAQLQGCLQN